MNAREIADALGVSHRTIYNWVEMGLPFYRSPRGLQMVMRFELEEVREWIKTQRSEDL